MLFRVAHCVAPISGIHVYVRFMSGYATRKLEAFSSPNARQVHGFGSGLQGRRWMWVAAGWGSLLRPIPIKAPMSPLEVVTFPLLPDKTFRSLDPPWL